jgi:uncharacterized protein (TIGR02145 family)
MKKIFYILTILAFGFTQAQPQKVNYQAVALTAGGQTVKNQAIKLRLSIVDSSATGTVLYTETHQPTTDGAGQFSVFLGGGTATLGTFSNIAWGNGKDKFLKAEADVTGGPNYVLMGTSQIVSLPYAIAAGSSKTADTAKVAKELEIGTIIRGNSGQTYQLTIGANGPMWTCFPPLTQANAGADQMNVCASSFNLAGNTPSNGTATWGILSGVGGSLGTPNVPVTTFTGVRGNSYTLRYSITNACGNSSDTVAVSLAPTTTPANVGPDQLNLTGTATTLAANAPAVGESGLWTIVTGSSASLSSTSDPLATFTKGTDSAYTLVWAITGSCSTSRDTLVMSFQNAILMNIPCPGVPTVSYGGQTYNTVQIGTQCWFKENLNVGAMVQGNLNQTNNSILEKYCYNNDPINCLIYGGLYQWAEAVQYQNGASNTSSPNPAFSGNVRGICPTGWHVPSDGEWCKLTTFLDTTVNCGAYGWSGTQAGGKMKTIDSLWTWLPNTGATNRSGFSAKPSGGFINNGIYTFNFLGGAAYFWSSSENSSSGANDRYLGYDNSDINRGINETKTYGFSVRCLKD